MFFDSGFQDYTDTSAQTSAPTQKRTRKPRAKKGEVTPPVPQDITVSNVMENFPNLPKKPRQRKAKVGQDLSDFNELTNRESVLECPDMYVDSINRSKNPFWVLQNNRIVKVTTDIPLGLSRLYIEIVANACDNATRCYQDGIDPGTIEITVTRDVVTVKNYGLPIPVIWNAEKGMWVPEWVLTNMKTGSSFRKQRHGGGRNGMGSTIVGYFSLWSKATVYDHLNHKAYQQEWANGLQQTTGPQTMDYHGAFSSTEFSYQVDLSRFGYPEQAYPELAYNLFARIAADASFTCKIPVMFNGLRMAYTSIVDYAKLYIPDFTNYVLHYKWPDEASISTQADGSQISTTNLDVPDIEMIVLDTPNFGLQLGLCNSLLNVDGGIHVNAAVKYVSGVIKEMIQSKSKKPQEKKEKTENEAKKNTSDNRITKKLISGNVTIIINVRLPNPTWTGQTKSYLRDFIIDEKTRQVGKFELIIPEATKKKILTWDLAKNMENYYKNQVSEMIKRSKKDSKKRIIGKHIEDCEYAKNPKMRKYVIQCWFEGESAKAYYRCIVTFTKDGTKKFQGVSLGGKINNTIKTSTPIDLLTNTLFQEIYNLAGLTWGMDYTIPGNIETLRCQAGFMLMTDQDPDGLHIKMLAIAFFYKYFPSILTMGLLYDWRTKLKTASRPGYSTVKFYYEKQYKEWEATLAPGELEKWTIKYFKGLGTTSEADAKLDAADPWIVRLWWDPSANKFLEMTMSGGDKTETKNWMMSYNPDKPPDPIVNNIQAVTSFINDEFITFCLYTLGRHLPSFSDGLNDARRKIICYAWKHKNWKRLTNCTQKTLMSLDTFASYTKAEMKYHHGDPTKVAANMTQSFVGHNPQRVFVPEGQFGTRFEGGKDCASARYPKLIPKAKWIKANFPEEDERILKYLRDEDVQIEPENYFPIIPYVLSTGWKGIAFGWSSTIPCYHYLEIIMWLVDRLNGKKYEDLPNLIPWYRDFTGTIEITDSRYVKEETYYDFADKEETIMRSINPPAKGKYSMVTRGVATGDPSTSLRITELPIGVWTKTYIENVLDVLVKDGKIKDYDAHNDIYKIDFTVRGFNFTEKDSNGNEVPRQVTMEDLKLVKAYGLGNMMLLDGNNRPVHYESAKHILEHYYQWRLPYYALRRSIMLEEKQKELDRAMERVKYIEACCSGDLDFKGANRRARAREDVLADVKRLGLSEEIHKTIGAHTLDDKGLEAAKHTVDRITEQGMEIYNMTPEKMWLNDLKRGWDTYVEDYGDDRPRR